MGSDKVKCEPWELRIGSRQCSNWFKCIKGEDRQSTDRDQPRSLSRPQMGALQEKRQYSERAILYFACGRLCLCLCQLKTFNNLMKGVVWWHFTITKHNCWMNSQPPKCFSLNMILFYIKLDFALNVIFLYNVNYMKSCSSINMILFYIKLYISLNMILFTWNCVSLWIWCKHDMVHTRWFTSFKSWPWLPQRRIA